MDCILLILENFIPKNKKLSLGIKSGDAESITLTIMEENKNFSITGNETMEE